MNNLRPLMQSDCFSYTLNIPVVYQFVGTNGLVEVEVKKDKSTTGWLFDDNHIYLVIDRNNKSEVYDIREIREGCKQQLSEKKFIGFSDHPVVGYMKQYADGRVVGWVDLSKI